MIIKSFFCLRGCLKIHVAYAMEIINFASFVSLAEYISLLLHIGQFKNLLFPSYNLYWPDDEPNTEKFDLLLIFDIIKVNSDSDFTIVEELCVEKKEHFS